MRLYLPFLGSRDYLHGTTLFDALAAHVPPESSITFKFSKMIRTNVIDLSDQPENAEASLTWRSDDSQGALYARSTREDSSAERRPYPEHLVGAATEIHNGVAIYEKESPFSFVATLIPIHKALLSHHGVAEGFPPGQWVFTRLDLNCRPRSFKTIDIRLGSVLGRQLVRSEIGVDGIAAGAIYFSWLQK